MKFFCFCKGHDELVEQLRFDIDKVTKERDRYIDLLMEKNNVTLPNDLPGERSENPQPIRKLTSRVQIRQQLEEEGRKKAFEQMERLKEAK